MNIRVIILENVVKVYSDSDFLFHFKVSRWDGTTTYGEVICTSCNMSGYCNKPIMFGTRNMFRGLICQKLGMELRPEISDEDAGKLISSVRGKIIKKIVRK